MADKTSIVICLYIMCFTSYIYILVYVLVYILVYVQMFTLDERYYDYGKYNKSG